MTTLYHDATEQIYAFLNHCSTKLSLASPLLYNETRQGVKPRVIVSKVLASYFDGNVVERIPPSERISIGNGFEPFDDCINIIE